MSKLEERLAKIFGVKDPSGIPIVSKKSLSIYSKYLNKHLTFPIRTLYAQKIEPFKTTRWNVKILGLANNDESNYTLVDDYKTWFWNNR